jgi:transcriptional regulator with XRE-family HTH domain
MGKVVVSNAFKAGWGDRLIAVRKSLHLTQVDLGKAIQVRGTAVSKWELEATQVDQRSLMALESQLGISPAWIMYGEAPMTLKGGWGAEMRAVLNEAGSGAVDGLWTVPPASGMAPLFLAGDVLLWETLGAHPLIPGAVYLVAAKGTNWPSPNIAPQKAKAGQAFPVEVEEGKIEWLIYRPEDRARPGSFPPVSLHDLEVIGRVVSYVRKVPTPVDL